ncbi:aminopeptidase P family protein [Alphaproteobacteria bacterium]|nr:aminopeptidase P family protein [Alphaproteobacteria bacterium]
MLSSELELLIYNMRQKKYDALLVPREDMFSGEEVPKSEERLKYITNFTGSAGFAIIVSNQNLKSAIFSDGRYQLQLKKQVDTKFFDVFNGGINEIGNFLKDNEKYLKIIAFDPWLLTSIKHEALSKILKSTPLILKATEKNLIDEIWKKRPTETQKSIFQLPIKRTGENFLSKINRLKKVITNIGGDYYVLFNPAGLSWLLNIRCRDLEYTPVSRSFCIISSEGEVFIFSDNSTFEIITKNHSKIHLLQINELTFFLKKLKNKNFLIDPVFLPLQIKYLILNMRLNIHTISCPIEEFKSVKNSNELNGFKVSHLKDGLAFLKLFFWLEKNLSSQHLTEITISKKLYEFRSLEETFICESFATISAFKDNGAIIHYKADKSSDKKIDKDGLYLIDSGAHYLEGTTDTTRTIKIGKVSEEMINNYTLVLKGHIAIATAIFPKNTKGREIDSLARKALWSEGKDYTHGTGHGVGCLLSVHEGPISISKHSKCDIKQGMVISNEPGYYKNGEYGIRIENLEVVSKKYLKNSENFLYFENLTRVPFELELINKEILTIDEINWINSYHEKVYRELANLITPNDSELLHYLKIKTLPI